MTRLLALLVVLATAAVLAACGGDDEAPEPPRLQPPAAATDTAEERAEAPARERPRERRERADARDDDDERSRTEAEQPRAGGGDGGGQRDEGEGERGRRPRRTRPLSEQQRRDLAAARQTVAEFIRRVNRRDGGVCSDLVTASYLRQVTGLTGAAAVRRCRSDISGARGPRVRINEFEGTRIVGDRALVQFTSSIGDFAKRQVLQLERARGRWLIDGAPAPADG